MKQPLNARTLMGVELKDLPTRLSVPLEAGAYKQIAGGPGGAAGLTDIKPVFMVEKLTEILGPVGIGWGYDPPVLLDPTDTTRADVSLSCWYAWVSEGVDEVQYARTTVMGGSKNIREWALKGAITSALSTWAYLIGFQWPVYKSERDENTIKSELRDGRNNDVKEPAEREAEKPAKGNQAAALNAILGLVPLEGEAAREWVMALSAEKIGKPILELDDAGLRDLYRLVKFEVESAKAASEAAERDNG